MGNETLSLISDICKRLGFSKSAFVVTGPETQSVAGRKVIDLLHDKGMDINHLIVTSSTVWDVRAVEERIRELKPQVVLGVGAAPKLTLRSLVLRVKEFPS